MTVNDLPAENAYSVMTNLTRPIERTFTVQTKLIQKSMVTDNMLFKALEELGS